MRKGPLLARGSPPVHAAALFCAAGFVCEERLAVEKWCLLLDVHASSCQVDL